MIREKFFDFFIRKGHTRVPSSSLIPMEDPTLLFTNAGMNQFKDIFLGKETRSYTRAVSIQKCIRAGGKHNDLENVGFTKRHLTFFEMMGNFSFGDYFKKEAIEYAWQFLTQTLSIPAQSLYASVYYKDDEAHNLWKNVIGLPESRIIRLGEADNFWQMGDTGPCGPCSEIYVDRGQQEGCQLVSCAPGCSCDRFLEIWNLVFMQYDRQVDGSDVPLAQKGVDTGMGLERLTALMQNKESVFDTDLFAPLMAQIETVTGKKYDSVDKAAFRVLADHIRSSAFAIADGGTPSNEGRGYVLRKIIRRAALFAQKLGDINVFASLVDPLASSMGALYPEIVTNRVMIKKMIESEIERFEHSLTTGRDVFEKYAREAEKERKDRISGADAFKLYDTFGFPLELTKVLAHERGLTVDIEGFESEMEKQRMQSGKKLTPTTIAGGEESQVTEFIGYESLTSTTSISAIIRDNAYVESCKAGEECFIVTKHSPFFAECGGQISDKGAVTVDGKATPLLELKKIDKGIAAKIVAPVTLKKGQEVTLLVEASSRLDTMKNHTATHLLQAALIELLGKQVRQSGSLVTPDYLRFDFTYHENLTPDQITVIEDRVNAKIMENIPVNTYTTDYQSAIGHGVIAIFGEKYNPESVRVIDVPGFSKELCGGTHVRYTGDIGSFKITEVSALSAGNRRVVAVTGPKAITLFQESFNIAKSLSQALKVKTVDVLHSFKKQQEQLKESTTKIKELKKNVWQLSKPAWLKTMSDVGGIPFLYLPLPQTQPEELRDIAEVLIKSQQGMYVLTAPTPEKTTILIALSPELTSKVDLQKVLEWLKKQGLSGGGSKTSLRASASYLDQTFINKLQEWLKASS